MDRIKIILKDQWNYDFDTGDHELLLWEGPNCFYCNTKLDGVYSYIIYQLDNAGLLPDDFKPACCYCYTLRKFGLINLKDHLVRFEYKEEEDILLISVPVSYKEITPEYKAIKWHEFLFRIHEPSKWA